jgi:hypothetical protein
MTKANAGTADRICEGARHRCRPWPLHQAACEHGPTCGHRYVEKVGQCGAGIHPYFRRDTQLSPKERQISPAGGRDHRLGKRILQRHRSPLWAESESSQ